MEEKPSAIEESESRSDSEKVFHDGDPEFIEVVSRESGEDIKACYQCHRCGSGCPVAPETDYTPDKLIRLIQLGRKQTALHARHLNTCVSCYTCAIRCPNGIDSARIAEALKEIGKREHVKAPKHEVTAFHDTFLASVEHFGRVNEAELMGIYTLIAGPDWKTILKSPGMFFKGRLQLWGGRIKGMKEIKKLFRGRK